MHTVGEIESKNGQLDQAGLREVIRHERRVETAFEGLRLFDLYRWKELKNAVDRINKEAADNMNIAIIGAKWNTYGRYRCMRRMQIRIWNKTNYGNKRK